MIYFSENFSSLHVLWQKEKQNEREIRRNCCKDLFFATRGFVTFENEVWRVQTPGAFLYKNLAFSTRFVIFRIVPAIFSSISCVVLNYSKNSIGR